MSEPTTCTCPVCKRQVLATVDDQGRRDFVCVSCHIEGTWFPMPKPTEWVHLGDCEATVLTDRTGRYTKAPGGATTGG
jgi:hypothetical protein